MALGHESMLDHPNLFEMLDALEEADRHLKEALLLLRPEQREPVGLEPAQTPGQPRPAPRAA